MNTKRWYRRPSIVTGASLLIALCTWSIAQPGPSVLPEGPPPAPGMQGEAGLPPAPPHGEFPPPPELRDNEAPPFVGGNEGPPQRAQSNDERYGRGPGGPGEAGPRGQFGPGQGRGGERWNEAGPVGPGPRGQFGPGPGRGAERWDEAGQVGPGPHGQFGPGQGRGAERWDEAGPGGPGPHGQFGPAQGRRGGCDVQDGRQGPVAPGHPRRIMGVRLDPDTIFNEMDADGSGTISREEFRAMHESRRPPMAPPAPDAPGMVPPGEPMGPPPVR